MGPAAKAVTYLANTGNSISVITSFASQDMVLDAGATWAFILQKMVFHLALRQMATS